MSMVFNYNSFYFKAKEDVKLFVDSFNSGCKDSSGEFKNFPILKKYIEDLYFVDYLDKKLGIKDIKTDKIKMHLELLN